MLNFPKRLIKSAARRIAGPGEIAKYHHRFDGMATQHNDRFREDPRYQAAYARAVQAGGWDYAVPWRVHQILWCVDQARKVEGDIVELGTARGFFMSSALAGWPDWPSSGRSIHLFDTFEPGWVEADGTRSGNSRFYCESFEAVEKNFAEWPRVNLVRGDVFETLPAQPIDKVAFLHIDLNHPDPEVFGLRHLWPRLSRGSVILLDDFAFRGRDAQFDAMTALSRELGFSIMSTPTGQGIAIV